jgi:hypothetical protein
MLMLHSAESLKIVTFSVAHNPIRALQYADSGVTVYRTRVSCEPASGRTGDFVATWARVSLAMSALAIDPTSGPGQVRLPTSHKPLP